MTLNLLIVYKVTYLNKYIFSIFEIFPIILNSVKLERNKLLMVVGVETSDMSLRNQFDEIKL